MKINELITDARQALDAISQRLDASRIAQSPEFLELLNSGLWDAPPTSLTDCVDCLLVIQELSAHLAECKVYTTSL
ncbi:MAG: hypothetical protein KME46_33100 [Brasilonema angustatum HA4187-MV1]|jgi:hypothetical protein|nr:hypothetical protein [Brasilonema angustatum HA4187-MV1]